MTSRTFQLMATAVLATALWVVPSVGTRGQGTIGDRFVHADDDLVTANGSGHALLQRADAAVVRAVTAL
jgi:hypothetical protein